MRSNTLKKTFCTDVTIDLIGQRVSLHGWVQIKREHGGVVFIDLRDRSGIVQLVFSEDYNSDIFVRSADLKPEYVIRAAGEIRRRENPNPNIPTGQVEVWVDELEVLNTSETVPIGVVKQDDVSEELRLRYRYIDLRREEMRNNILMRHRISLAVIRYLDEQGFVNIETPFLTKSTPEGARDFLVPSRLNRGKFYALPQSPQIFKQLLMVSGFERYFQIVKCFRDEDLRADRQPEFTQIDIEASFIEEQDIFELVDGMFQHILESCYGKSLSTPVQRISHDRAIELYGTDRPDLRIPYNLFNIGALSELEPGDLIQKKLDEGHLFYGLLLPLEDSISRKQLDAYAARAKEKGLELFTWLKGNFAAGTHTGGESKNSPLSGPMVKLFKNGLDRHLELLRNKGCTNESQLSGKPFILLAALGERKKLLPFLGVLRTEKGVTAAPENEMRFCWIVDFPLFEWSDEEGRIVSVHHPFTSPKVENESGLDEAILNVKSRSYDFVLNGIELGGGSIRIHRRRMQEKVFELLGLSREEAVKKFGFLLEALQYGAPPHGGIAFGLDRIVMMLQGKDSIRDVIPFPKTSSGLSPLSGAPDSISETQLKELGLKLME
jgi:aspartyl-tRNA synthetase